MRPSSSSSSSSMQQTREIKILNTTFPSSNPSLNHMLSYEQASSLNDGQSFLAKPDAGGDHQLHNHYSSTTSPAFSPWFHSRPQFFLPHYSSSCSWRLSTDTNHSSYCSTNGGEAHFQEGGDDLEVFKRRCKRLQSNRESARRSRKRKQQQLDDLLAEVQQMEMMNSSLSDKVVNLLEYNQQILLENAQLKEENCLYHKLLLEGSSQVNYEL